MPAAVSAVASLANSWRPGKSRATGRWTSARCWWVADRGRPFRYARRHQTNPLPTCLSCSDDLFRMLGLVDAISKLLTHPRNRRFSFVRERQNKGVFSSGQIRICISVKSACTAAGLLATIQLSSSFFFPFLLEMKRSITHVRYY
jgi:hypothetical protein